jgi:hypothetical protein
MSEQTTRLVRSGKGGATIHLAGCSRMGSKFWPWNWAEGRDDSEWVGKGWLHPCRACLPELAQVQDDLKAGVKP